MRARRSRRAGRPAREESSRRRRGARQIRCRPAVDSDFLALVGDAADGYPGIAGIGPITAARMLMQYGPIERFPAAALGARRELALRFKALATLRSDAPLFRDVDALRWRGPKATFASWAARMEAPRLLERAVRAHAALH